MSAAPGSMLLSPHYRFSNDGGATQLEVYQRFVGSLRKSGYKGNVVLGVIPEESDPDASNILNRYLKYRNVTVYPIKFVPCTSDAAVGLAGHKSKSEACVHPYPDSKLQWSRYHLARDWLDACHHCGDGPVLLIDLRDTLFQRNPFESALTIGGLQLFEEDSSRTTLHWTTDLAFKGCKGMRMNETMLASGAVLGTRIAVNKYFEIINEEMKRWMADSNCRHHWDDQAVQNYLFYTEQIPFARPVKNGHGMVLNVGIKGEAVMQRHKAFMAKRYQLPPADAVYKPFRGADKGDPIGQRWIGEEANVTDANGVFLQANGKSIAQVVHQIDSFGPPFMDLWLRHQSIANNFLEANSGFIKKQPRPVPSGVHPHELRQKTDTGIDISDPVLFLPLQPAILGTLQSLVWRTDSNRTYFDALSDHCVFQALKGESF